MANTWETVTTDPGSGGANVAGETFTQGTVKFIPASVLGIPDGAGQFDMVQDSIPLPTKVSFITPLTAFATSAAISAGSTANLDSTQINSGLTGKLVDVIVAASVPWKAELRTVQNAIESSILAVWFSFGQKLVLPSKEFITVAHDAGAGLDGFRVLVTNLDVGSAADLYATFIYDEE